MIPTAIFLREDIVWDVEPEIIVEENTKNKTFFIKSLNAIQVDKKNKNQRVYRRQIVENELNKRYIPEYVEQGRAWGELGHPESHRIIEQNISHRFKEIFPYNQNYFGVKAKIFETPNGKIVKALLEDKEGKLGISTRAIGTVKNESGINYVQEDFHLITAGDIVVDPSAELAFVSGIMENHQKYYMLVENEIVEIVRNNIEKEYKLNMPIEEKRKLLVDNFKYLFKGIPLRKNINFNLNEQFVIYKEELNKFYKFLDVIKRKYKKEEDIDFISIKELIPEDSFENYKLYIFKESYMGKMMWFWRLSREEYKNYEDYKKQKTHLEKDSYHGKAKNDFNSSIDDFKNYMKDMWEIIE